MKAYIKTFGCRVNQVESQALLESLAAAGYVQTHEMAEADLCLLNTCSVTHNADKDAEREMRKITRANPSARLIVTGCYAMAAREKIQAAHPRAEVILKHEIAPKLFGKEIDWTVKEHFGHSRAFVKIQDGCDCFCSFCIVPYTRPQKTSKPAAALVAEIKNLLAGGYKEIVLTGINIGNYKCPQTGADLAEVLPAIFALPCDFRVRFSSIEINTVTDKLLGACAAGGDKFCNYLHLPLQSGSEAVLQNMRRRYGAADYLKRVGEIRAALPGVALYADIIAGYPTETKEDFAASLAFVEQVKFAGLHVFSYSPRSGTPAAAMAQLPHGEIKKRSEVLRSKDAQLRAGYAASLVGQTHQVLTEEADASGVGGVLGSFQRVIIKGAHPTGELRLVKITSADNGVCRAVFL